ncbi:MAG: hypothetical protein KDC54_09505 [Lewinella sp.]|nr:hypothetical protein [Lewinella sp.]
MPNPSRPRLWLGVIIALAIVARLLFLWAGRPEFVGWFNHTYYYYVEVRGLLLQGALPYSDMPLLFYLYAGTARLLSGVGMELSAAIVAATRFWMCIIPSLIPLPVYATLRLINQGRKLDFHLWALVVASGFLPLTVLYLPEFLQKNTLGLLELALLLWLSRQALANFSWKKAAALALIFLLIVLTHFGSAGVAVLGGFALLLAFAALRTDPAGTLRMAGASMLGLVMFLGLIYLFDPTRFLRVIIYLQASWKTSFLGLLFSREAVGAARWSALAGTVIPLLAAGGLYGLYRRQRAKLPAPDRLFWLSLIIWAYLLILPVYDQLLLGRLALFLPLPLLLILAYLLTYANWKPWLRTALVTLVIAGTGLLLFGEFMSRQQHNPNKTEIYADLLTLKAKVDFSPDDLILARNGVEHVGNWFLGARAGVITALQREDFDTYARIFILNPAEGRFDPSAFDGRQAAHEADRYFFMLHNIPPPAGADTLYRSPYLELFRLPEPPTEWVFDETGQWMGYNQ